MAGLNLKQFNLASLQNLTMDDLRSLAVSHKEIALTIVIVLLSLFLGFFKLHEQWNRIGELKAHEIMLVDKESPVDALKKSLLQKEEFLSTLPAVFTKDNIISFMSELATKYGLQIIAFRSPTATQEKFVRKVSLNLDLFAPGFKEAMLFLTGLEYSDRSLRVDFWGMIPNQEKTLGKGGLKLNVLVTSYQLMDEEESREE